MRLAILGATGRIGLYLLDWALDNGHQVHALARSAQALPDRAGLTVTPGDALDPVAVAEVISDADAVLSVLGPRGAKTSGLLAGAASNIVAAMGKTGVRRLVCVSAAGAFITGDPGSAWLVKLILPRILAKPFADTRQMEDLIRASDLDWTLIRPVRLLNRPGTGKYRVRPDYPPPHGNTIGRADVAHFAAAVLTEHAWSHASPAIAY
jgi:putative NADH-flavin reductase